MDKIDMLRIETIVNLALLARRRAVVETQTIEQFLVAKGICTIEEFRAMRKKVEANSTEVKDLDEQLAYQLAKCDVLSKDVDATVEFSRLFSKALDGEQLSEAEHDILEKTLYGETED